MSPRRRDYRRLPGRVMLARHTLWAGDDHLLSVANHGFSERYHRLDYGQILGVYTSPSRSRRIWTLVFAMSAATMFLNASLLLGRLRWTALGAGVGLALCLLLNELLGPTCRTWVRTVTGFHLMPALNRTRAADRFLAALRPLVAAAAPPAEETSA